MATTLVTTKPREIQGNGGGRWAGLWGFASRETLDPAHEADAGFARLHREETAVFAELQRNGHSWSLLEGKFAHWTNRGCLNAIEFVRAGTRDDGAVGVNFELRGRGLGQDFGADPVALGPRCRVDESALDEG
jgi:hypothetical protein